MCDSHPQIFVPPQTSDSFRFVPLHPCRDAPGVNAAELNKMTVVMLLSAWVMRQGGLNSLL